MEGVVCIEVPENCLEGDKRVDQEEHELFVVEQSNASAYPGAVMIHAHHTLVAHAAVVGTRRLHDFARLAELESVEVIRR